VPTSINDDRLRALLSVGQSLLSAYTAELSKNEEIVNSDNDDDDFPFVRRILALLKRVIKVINFTCDKADDSKVDDDNYIEVSWLRYTRTA
jgi:hypothetical protein